MEKLEKEEVELVACDARQLWLRRNIKWSLGRSCFHLLK